MAFWCFLGGVGGWLSGDLLGQLWLRCLLALTMTKNGVPNGSNGPTTVHSKSHFDPPLLYRYQVKSTFLSMDPLDLMWLFRNRLSRTVVWAGTFSPHFCELIMQRGLLSHQAKSGLRSEQAPTALRKHQPLMLHFLQPSEVHLNVTQGLVVSQADHWFVLHLQLAIPFQVKEVLLFGCHVNLKHTRCASWYLYK